jgi:hypothetical protein
MIVPQQSIDGVHLLMSAAGVRHVLGAPKSTRSVKDEIQGSIRLMDYGKTKVYLSATEDGTVFSVTTTDRRQRTAKGAGVGSTRGSVLRKVPKVHCDTATCTVGQLLSGRRVTSFALSKGKVRAITLGFVID